MPPHAHTRTPRTSRPSICSRSILLSGCSMQHPCESWMACSRSRTMELGVSHSPRYLRAPAGWQGQRRLKWVHSYGMVCMVCCRTQSRHGVLQEPQGGLGGRATRSHPHSCAQCLGSRGQHGREKGEKEQRRTRHMTPYPVYMLVASTSGPKHGRVATDRQLPRHLNARCSKTKAPALARSGQTGLPPTQSCVQRARGSPF